MFSPDTHWNRLQQKRGFLFRISLIISLIIVILAFSWTTYDLIEAKVPEKEEFNEYADINVTPVTISSSTKDLSVTPIRPKTQFANIISGSDPEPMSHNMLLKKDLKLNFDSIVTTLDRVPGEVIKQEFVPFVPFPERLPEFIGGPGELSEYLKKIDYCNGPYDESRSGTIFVSFMISEKGKISHVKLENHLTPCIDKAVVSHIQKMPNWRPAMQGEQKVKTIARVKLIFKDI